MISDFRFFPQAHSKETQTVTVSSIFIRFNPNHHQLQFSIHLVKTVVKAYNVVFLQGHIRLHENADCT